MFAFHSPDIVASSFTSPFRSNLVIGAVPKFASYLHVVFQSDEVPLPPENGRTRDAVLAEDTFLCHFAPENKNRSAAVDEVLEEAAL